MIRRVLLGLALLVGCATGGPKPAPRVSGRTFDGSAVALGAPAAKPTLIVFWATWCEVCRHEMPKLAQLSRERGEVLGIVGVNVDTDVGVARRFLEETPLPYPNVSDPALVIADAFGASATPTLILVDREGNEIERGNAIEALLPRLTDTP